MKDLILKIKDEHSDFLWDESRKTGNAEYISFPKSNSEIINILKFAYSNQINITVQGSLTGIVAGAVPNDGIILNLSKLNKINQVEIIDENLAYITVEPGALLSDIRKSIEDTGYFFPNDPTETSASIGGMVASNSSGALTYSYGSIRPWIQYIEVALSNGDTLCITRGEHFATENDFSLTTTDGNIISGTLPQVPSVDIKSTAGYYIRPNMDLIDLFIGMEGTLGIITNITLKLTKKPNDVAGIVVFFPNEELAIDFVKYIRGEDNFEDLSANAIEYFNSGALNLVNKMKTEREIFKEIPPIKPEYKSAIYIEFHRDSEDEIEESIGLLMEILEHINISDDDTWCAFTPQELEKLKIFRHAIPESVNLLIGEIKKKEPTLTKLSTDMSVPNDKLEWIFNMYNKDMQENNLMYVIFGHIGNNHLHVNIIPQSKEEFLLGKKIYLKWAKEVTDNNGSVSAEHGIGKIKKDFLNIMFNKEQISDMLELSKKFDDKSILNNGNLF